MFIDTHTHLYDDQLIKDINQVIDRALAVDVQMMLLPNCNISTVSSMMQVCNKYPKNCLPMIGLHPCDVFENFKADLDELYKLLDNNQYVAIGEVGLDYYWDKKYISHQKIAFETQIDWALNHNLPLSIHTRDAISDGIFMVREKQNGNLKGAFHCFSGSLEQAKQIVDLGFYLGIGGVISFKNSNLKDIIKQVPIEHIILETDAPYLAPTPFRGKRNESSYIPIIADVLSQVYDIPIDEVERQTTANALQLFDKIKV